MMRPICRRWIHAAPPISRRFATKSNPTTSVDHAEISKFSAQAADWWHPNGTAAPLHRMNPARIAYIRSTIEKCVLPAHPQHLHSATCHQPLSGVDVIDVGCGGGLVTEPLARLGAKVLGVDMSKEAIAVAKLHAEKDPSLTDANILEYREASIEEVDADFHVVLALEIVEHAAKPDSFIRTCAARVRPGGVLILSTLNRTLTSYALSIVAAERVLKWLPPGTHDWTRFPTPEEVADVINNQTSLNTEEVVGVGFNPLKGSFSIVENTSVNYILTAVQPSTHVHRRSERQSANISTA